MKKKTFPHIHRLVVIFHLLQVQNIVVTSTRKKNHSLHKLVHIAYLLLIFLLTLLISLLQAVLQIQTLKWRLNIKMCDDAFLSAEDDEISKAIDPGLWIDLSTDNNANSAVCKPTDCQNHHGPLDKSAGHLIKENQQDTVRKNSSMA